MNKRDKVGMNNSNEKNIEMENNKNSLNPIAKEEIEHMEEFEDITKYGEFVSSYFAWLTLEKQKENVRNMENMTKKE